MKALAAVAGLAAIAHCASAPAQEPASNDAASPCELCEVGKTVVVDTREVFTAPVR